MTTEVSIIERVIMHGDLSKLTSEQKTKYYLEVCNSVGLNPLTQPLAYIKLNGKETLYATRAATDQLRQINKISITIVSREQVGDLFVVTARATNHEGRQDESTGAVCTTGLRGEALANAMLKSETKSKRRVTLSICGLGLLDETEVASITSSSVSPVLIDTKEAKKPVAHTETPHSPKAPTLKIDVPTIHGEKVGTGEKGKSVTPQASKPITDKQRKFIWATFKGLGFTDDEIKHTFTKVTGKAHSSEWVSSDIDKLVDYKTNLSKNNPQLPPAPPVTTFDDYDPSMQLIDDHPPGDLFT
jgi:hypothetical protein